MPITCYCEHCGSKTVADVFPRFCSSCSRPFVPSSAASSVNSPKLSKRIRKEEELETDPDDGTDVYEMPVIKGTQFSVDYDNKPRGITLGEINTLNKTNKKKSKTRIKNEPSKPVGIQKSPEQILAEFRAEISNNPKPIDIE
jgi:hypothetical protein